MSYKQEFEYLRDNDLIKFLFYYEFDNEEWTRIILGRIHDGNFWLGNNVVEIYTNFIHEVTRLCNEGSIPVNEKNVKKLVSNNTKILYKGKGMVINKVRQHDGIFISRIISTRICYGSREDDMAFGFIQEAYKICVDKEKVNLCEILRT